MTKDEIQTFFELLRRQNPNPKCELNFKNAYTRMVAIILSAQATDKGVNKATEALCEKIQTPEQMLALGEDGLREYVKSLNYFNNKSRNIIRMTEVLLDKYKGEFPRDLDELQTLPGVGRKTANVFLNVLEHRPLIAVDTHVFRLGNRLGLAPGKTPLDVEMKLAQVVPDEFKPDAQHWLVLLGRYTCKAKHPKCHECPVASVCHAAEKAI